MPRALEWKPIETSDSKRPAAVASRDHRPRVEPTLE